MNDSELENTSKLFNSGLGIAIGAVIAGVASLLTRVVLGRLLQPEKYGVLNEGLAFMNFFIIFSLLGLGNTLARFISHGEEKDGYTSPVLAVSLPLSFLSGALLFLSSGLFASWMGSPELETVLKLFSFSIPASVAVAVFISDFRGREKTLEKVALEDLLLPLSILILSAIFTLYRTAPSYAAAGYVFSAWIVLVSAIVLYRMKGLRFVKPSTDRAKKLVRFSTPLWFSDLARFGIIWANIFILGFFLTSNETGLYNAAYPLTYTTAMVLSSLGYLYLPLISSLHSKGRFEEMKSLYNTVVRWVVTLILPVTLVFILKSEPILHILYGPSYVAASTLLTILILGRFVQTAIGPVGRMLIAFGETRKEALSQITGLAVIVLGSIVLVQEVGLLGAGIAYAAGVSIANIMRLNYSRRYASFNPLKIDLKKPVIAAIPATFILLIPTTSLIIDLAFIAGSGLIYATALLALKPLKHEDIHSIEQMLGRTPLSGTDKIVDNLRRFEE